LGSQQLRAAGQCGCLTFFLHVSSLLNGFFMSHDKP
jgi:hypothetical protein